jgi:hypothetical protein
MPRSCAAASAHRLEPAEPGAPRGEGFAVEEFHHEVAAAARQVAEVEDLDDAGMADRGGRARFVEEPRDGVAVIRQLRQQHLDRCAAAEQRVFREVHRAHAALADPRCDLVVADAGAQHSGASLTPSREPTPS